MLTKDQKFLFYAIVLVLEQLDIIDTLLQFFVIFFLKGVDIKDKKVAIVAAYPSQIVVHAATEKTVAGRLLYDYRAELLVINVQLVAFTAREDKA